MQNESWLYAEWILTEESMFLVQIHKTHQNFLLASIRKNNTDWSFRLTEFLSNPILNMVENLLFWADGLLKLVGNLYFDSIKSYHQFKILTVNHTHTVDKFHYEN